MVNHKISLNISRYDYTNAISFKETTLGNRISSNPSKLLCLQF